MAHVCIVDSMIGEASVSIVSSRLDFFIVVCVCIVDSMIGEAGISIVSSRLDFFIVVCVANKYFV